MEEPLFSVSVICKNEETSLHNMIESLAEFIGCGGEVVVVDTGSTDRSIEILKEYGFAKDTVDGHPRLRYQTVSDKFDFVIDEDMAYEIRKRYLAVDDKDFIIVGKTTFDFGAARRYAGSLCANDWILSLDCDEIISKLSISFLNKIIRTNDTQQLSFPFVYRNTDGSAASYTMRDKFYNRNYGDWKWIVHEQVKPLPNKTVRIVQVTEHTLSIDHYQHPAEHRSNYLVNMCIDVMKDPNDQHVFWLGREMYTSGHYNSSIKLLKEYLIDYDKTAYSGEKCMACVIIGNCYMNLSNTLKPPMNDDALLWFIKAGNCDSTFREPWVRLAELCYQERECSQVIRWLTIALKIKDNPKTYLNSGFCYGVQPYKMMYTSYLSVGNVKKAVKYLNEALKLEPTNVEFQTHAKTLVAQHDLS